MRNKIIEKLNKHKLVVKTLLNISEIVDGRITISDIKDLNIDDLLNRKQVKPDLNLLTKYKFKTVLVTGAEAQLGLNCADKLKLRPNKLILLELNSCSLQYFEDLVAE